MKIQKPSIVAFLTAVILAIIFYPSLKNTFIVIQENPTRIYSPIAEYEELLKPGLENRLKFYAGSISPIREPSVNYILDNKYRIYISKVMLDGDLPIDALINIQNRKPGNMDGPSSEAGEFNCNYRFRRGKIDAVSKVDFIVDGEKLNVSKGKNYLSLSVKYHSFGILLNGEYYLMTAKADNKPVFYSLVFIKKNRNLYIVDMALIKETVFDESLLLNLISK